MNVNYVGSLAQRKLQFSSVVDVQNIDKSDLFNAVSIYMPLSFAPANLIGFAASVDKNTPALIALTVDNYKSEVQGDLLAQVTPMFVDDTNSDITVYIIVFLDTDTSPTMWAKGANWITFAPITNAYQGLYFLSFIKMLFYPDYSGASPVTAEGTPSTITLTLHNPTGSPITVPQGSYTVPAGNKTYGFTLAVDQTINAGASLAGIVATATVNGTTTAATSTPLTYSSFTAALNSGLTASITAVAQGTANTTVTSAYFALALALAYQAKSDPKLSAFWCVAMLDFDLIDDVAGTDTNPCKIRAATAAQEIAAMTSISSGNTTEYFWGALNLMGVQNTFVAVDCVPTRNLLALILYSWFAGKNASGEYVGNKLSLIRITGQNCFGPVSPINGAYNAGDSGGYDIFDSKNVGVLEPISGSNSGDSALSMCRGVTGIPMGAIMIAKFADYSSSQQLADVITDKGTLVNPVLTNDDAYKKIQNMVIGNIMKFASTGRVEGIISNLPSFAQAKVGRTALEAASSWSAIYIDDLDTVTISGGITAA